MQLPGNYIMTAKLIGRGERGGGEIEGAGPVFGIGKLEVHSWVHIAFLQFVGVWLNLAYFQLQNG